MFTEWEDTVVCPNYPGVDIETSAPLLSEHDLTTYIITPAAQYHLHRGHDHRSSMTINQRSLTHSSDKHSDARKKIPKEEVM